MEELLNPFIPFSCEEIRKFLAIEQPEWKLISVPANRKVHNLKILFERIDISRIEEETSLLEKQKQQG
jgi:methionyl-tRNA synthetase